MNRKECATCGAEVEDTLEALKAHYAEAHPEAGKEEEPVGVEKLNVVTPPIKEVYRRMTTQNPIDPRLRPGGRYKVVTPGETPVPPGSCDYCHGTGFVFIQVSSTNVQPGLYQVKSKRKPCIVCNGNNI